MKPYKSNKFKHKREWRNASFNKKLLLYLKPYWRNLYEIWEQPLPFPTSFKLIYTFFLTILILMPILIPIFITLFYSIIGQYLLERHTNLKYPSCIDVIGILNSACTLKLNGFYKRGVKLYFHRFALLFSTAMSTVDYIRIIVSFLE